MLYLDNGATTLVKPRSVFKEISKCMVNCGNPGRGSHKMSVAASEKLYELRALAAELFGLDKPENTAITLNTTYALNLIIKGVLRSGDHVLISDMEHNSVLRPIDALARAGVIEYDVFSAADTQYVCRSIESKLKPNTRAVICLHASNIVNTSLPLAEIGNICLKHGLIFIVDAAQSAGTHEINMEKMNVSALCVPSHKGLYGPQGCGLMLTRNIELETIIEGGSGVNSLETSMPDFFPDRLEAGTMPTPAAAGLCAGIRFVMSNGCGAILEKESELSRSLAEKLKNDDRITVYDGTGDGGICLFNAHGISCERIAAELNRQNIFVRAGLHCAPLAHKTIKTGITTASGAITNSGAVRVSFGAFNKPGDISIFCDALAKILKS